MSAFALRWVIVFALSFAVVAAVGAAAHVQGISVGVYTRDIAIVAGVHPLTGVLSNLGLLLWCGTVATCLIAASLLREKGRIEDARFLMLSGALSGLLLVDDMFMFHDLLAEQLLGLSETKVYLLYVMAAGGYLFAYRRRLLRHDASLLLTALTLFAVSILVDRREWVVRDHVGHWAFLLEDGPKFMGIGFWYAYYFRQSSRLVSSIWAAQAPLGGVLVKDPVRSVAMATGEVS